MTDDYRTAAHDVFCRAEDARWDERPGAALTRFTWRSWYRLERAHVDRLLAEAAMFQAGDPVGIGGLPRLHERVVGALAELGPPPAPTSVVQTSDEHRVESLEARSDYGQLVCDVPSRDRVATEVCRDFPYGGSVLFLGDDDLVCEPVAAAGFKVVVVDLDERVGERISGLPGAPRFKRGDVRHPLDVGRFDAVVLDPADGSVALTYWLSRVRDHLGTTDGSRVYLSVNLHRLGRRWTALLDDLARQDLVPVRQHERLKRYPFGDRPGAATDLWVFERMTRPSNLPLPYVEIETHR